MTRSPLPAAAPALAAPALAAPALAAPALAAPALAAPALAAPALALAAALCSLAPQAAQAHPHVFADSHAGFTFDDAGRLAGLRITWLYDAFTTLVLYDQLSLDQDGDGKLDDADLARVAQGETDWPPDYQGDTYLWVAGAARALGRPANGTARMVGDQVEVSFDLPLAEPATVGQASLKLYDPGYYYAYSIKGLTGALPARCTAEVIPFAPGSADRKIMATLAALSREDIPEDPEIGARFADEVRLSCR